MIVDRLRADGRGGRVERSARLRWQGGEFRLAVTVPAEVAPGRPDASPFVCASLLLAMRLGEDLDVRGPVSPPLLASAPRIVDLYASWDPRLYRTRLRAEATLAPGPRAAGVGCFLSRGVDSLYSSAVPRALPGPLTDLVFCDRLEPRHSRSTRAEERRLAREAADQLDLPLIAIESNVRELTDPIVGDWEDMAGAGLALLATSLAGALGHVVIPSSDGPTSIGPCGTSPLLDPLFSTAELEVMHDMPQTRVAKVAWLSRERRDLLPYLKVCFEADRPDNCGRCSKCVLTMLALEVAGTLREASGFAPEVDPEALSDLEIRFVHERIEFEAIERALRARGGQDDLVAAVSGALERGAALDPGFPITERTPDFRRRAARHALLLTRRDPPPRAEEPIRQPRLSRPSAPRTTVMMAAFEASATLRESVASVLAQTVAELELIVVDDGSSTPVASILADLRDPRLRVIRHARNRGLARARNTALAAARAPLVSQLDADDTWEPDYLAAVLPRFEDQGVGLVYTNAVILGHPGGLDDYIGDPSVHPMDRFPKIAEQNPIPSPTATMRTQAVRGVGGYAWWLRQCEDYHLYLKLAQAGWRFAYVHRRLARYRWPEPRRGMSYDTRRHELCELAMFGSIVARHPRTPGPRRQVRNRLRREVEQVRAIGELRLPPREQDRVRVLVDPGSHAVLNLGDIAMLQVCVERLRGLVDSATIEVITADPERLARYCPGVVPVPASGLYEWFESRWSGGAYSPLLPERTRERLLRGSRTAGRAGPRAGRLALGAELLARGPVSDEVRTFLASLAAADAIVVSGRGGTTDAFREDGLRMLELLRLAADLGATTAMVSQGLGPVEDGVLRSRAAEALPRLDLIAVRDRLSSQRLLEDAGVARERITVTGDDALAAAFEQRPPAASATGLGVGLRSADYAAITDEARETIGRALKELAARHRTELVGIPISLYPHEADSDAIAALTGGDDAGVDTPRAAIERAGACRVVVTASYHAAVFALAQGVPVVGLSSSGYYDAKLRGLADLFGDGCTVIGLTGSGSGERIRAAVDAAWTKADALRPALLAATERQIVAADEAYERLAAAVGATGPGGFRISSNGNRSGSVTWRRERGQRRAAVDRVSAVES